MRLAKYLKTPDEVKRYTIDYQHWLDAGEYVESVAFETISTNTGTLTCLPENIGATDTTVDFFVSGGTHGQDYTVSVQMTTDGGQVKEDTIVFTVRNP